MLIETSNLLRSCMVQCICLSITNKYFCDEHSRRVYEKNIKALENLHSTLEYDSILSEASHPVFNFFRMQKMLLNTGWNLDQHILH